jgi:hypothetical protein
VVGCRETIGEKWCGPSASRNNRGCWERSEGVGSRERRQQAVRPLLATTARGQPRKTVGSPQLHRENLGRLGQAQRSRRVAQKGSDNPAQYLSNRRLRASSGSFMQGFGKWATGLGQPIKVFEEESERGGRNNFRFKGSNQSGGLESNHGSGYSIKERATSGW